MAEEHAVNLVTVISLYPVMLCVELCLQNEPELLDLTEENGEAAAARRPLLLLATAASEARGPGAVSGCLLKDCDKSFTRINKLL